MIARHGTAARLAICVTLFAAAACSPTSHEPPGGPPDPDLTGMEPRVRELLAESRQAVLDSPQEAERWGVLGAVYHSHRLPAEAESCYRRARELDPDAFRWAYLLAVIHEERGTDTGELTGLFDAAAGLRPGYAPLWVRLGDAMSIRGDYDAAAAAFLRAIELAPEEPMAHRGLGQVRWAVGDARAALAPLERSMELLPDDRVTLGALAQVYARLDRAEESAASEQRATRAARHGGLSDPVMEREVLMRGISASRALDRAVILVRQGENERAIVDLRIVEESRTQDPVVQYWLGVAHARLGRSGQAQQYFLRALELNPELAQAVVELARLNESLGGMVEAEAGYRRALELRPDSGPLLAALARVQGRRKQFAASAATYARAAERTELSSRDRFLWSVSVLYAGETERAIGMLQQVVEGDPGNADAHYQLGTAYERERRRAEAIAAFEAAARAGHPRAAGHADRLRDG